MSLGSLRCSCFAGRVSVALSVDIFFLGWLLVVFCPGCVGLHVLRLHLAYRCEFARPAQRRVSLFE